MSCGIYKITNQINGHSYIGQSINIENRWVHHKNYNKKNSNYPLYLAFEKYGIENFSFEIIEKCEPKELNEKEIYWIKYYDTYNNGYNQTTGGEGSSNSTVKLSKEDIKIIYDLLLNSIISQKEISNMFNVGEDTISEINQGKTRIDPNLNYPLRNNKSEQKYCIICGQPVYRTSTYCNLCRGKISRKTERPSREELKQLIRILPFTQIAFKYGVSDNAIRKWCDTENLPKTKKEINSYSDEDWTLL